MAGLPIALVNLQAAFAKLPGIGPKSAQRIAFWLINQPKDTASELISAIDDASAQIHLCSECFNYSDSADLCNICGDSAREHATICVVSEPKDVTAFELAGGYKGAYHVLGGLISPMDGIGPDDLHLKELYCRIKQLCSKTDNKTNNRSKDKQNHSQIEIILATSFNSSGQATASFLEDKISALPEYKSQQVIITRLATGLPVGGEVDLADAKTLAQSLHNRQAV